MNNRIAQAALCFTLLCCTGQSSTKSSKQRPQRSWNIETVADSQKFESKLAAHLTQLARVKIKMLEEKSGKAFRPPQDFGNKQQTAAERFSQQVLPHITKEVELPASSEDNEPTALRMIAIEKIEALSPAELSKVLEGCFNLMGLFPPLPAHAEAWAHAVTPLFSLDKAARSQFTQLLESWLDALLEQDDIAALASLSTLPKQAQQDRIKELRAHYTDLTNNVSQLIYTWVQMSTILNKDNPWRVFLRHTTTKPNALEKKLNMLRERTQEALNQQQKKATSEDIDGILLLSLASLFAPEAVWQKIPQQTMKGSAHHPTA